jgi:hypothetical protein
LGADASAGHRQALRLADQRIVARFDRISYKPQRCGQISLSLIIHSAPRIELWVA